MNSNNNSNLQFPPMNPQMNQPNDLLTQHLQSVKPFYMYYPRIYAEISTIMQERKQFGTQLLNGPNNCVFATITGTIETQQNQSINQISIIIYLPYNYPYKPPHCVVNVPNNMEIVPNNQIVRNDRTIHNSYLDNWNENCNIPGLLNVLIKDFNTKTVFRPKQMNLNNHNSYLHPNQMNSKFNQPSLFPNTQTNSVQLYNDMNSIPNVNPQYYSSPNPQYRNSPNYHYSNHSTAPNSPNHHNYNHYNNNNYQNRYSPTSANPYPDLSMRRKISPQRSPNQLQYQQEIYDQHSQHYQNSQNSMNMYRPHQQYQPQHQSYSNGSKPLPPVPLKNQKPLPQIPQNRHPFIPSVNNNMNNNLNNNNNNINSTYNNNNYNPFNMNNNNLNNSNNQMISVHADNQININNQQQMNNMTINTSGNNTTTVIATPPNMKRSLPSVNSLDDFIVCSPREVSDHCEIRKEDGMPTIEGFEPFKPSSNQIQQFPPMSSEKDLQSLINQFKQPKGK